MYTKAITEIKMIAKIMTVCNHYETDTDRFLQYIREENIEYPDLLMYHNYISSELKRVDDCFQDIVYSKQIEETFNIIPKQIETFISKELLEQVLGLENTFVEDNLEFEYHIKEITITGYKFQLKYFLHCLDELMNAPIWEVSF